jgi:hypothetical protein
VVEVEVEVSRTVCRVVTVVDSLVVVTPWTMTCGVNVSVTVVPVVVVRWVLRLVRVEVVVGCAMPKHRHAEESSFPIFQLCRTAGFGGPRF